jgi:hypothetical protein
MSNIFNPDIPFPFDDERSSISQGGHSDSSSSYATSMNSAGRRDPTIGRLGEPFRSVVRRRLAIYMIC